MSTITVMPCPFCEAFKAEIASLKSRESPEDAWKRALVEAANFDESWIPPYTPPK